MQARIEIGDARIGIEHGRGYRAGRGIGGGFDEQGAAPGFREPAASTHPADPPPTMI